MPEDFVIARNTEPGSTLPYLLRVPLGDGIILKAGGGLLSDFDRYLDHDPAPDRDRDRDRDRDGADHRVAAMWLTDAEFVEFRDDLLDRYQPRPADAPGSGRRRRMAYTSSYPHQGRAVTACRPARCKRATHRLTLMRRRVDP